MIRYIKNGLALLLILIIFISSLGIEVNSHYCNMSKEREISMTVFNIFDEDATFIKESKSNCCIKESKNKNINEQSFNFQDNLCCKSLSQNYILDFNLSLKSFKDFKVDYSMNAKYKRELFTLEEYDKFKSKVSTVKSLMSLPFKAIKFFARLYSNTNKDKDPNS
ncbi:MAG: hypothetical protein NTW25_07135 [Candidatus Kapabacteria bacterium]|nr:hypothetical protein [Candidatus Kapabacteria bacterium]